MSRLEAQRVRIARDVRGQRAVAVTVDGTLGSARLLMSIPMARDVAAQLAQAVRAHEQEAADIAKAMALGGRRAR